MFKKEEKRRESLKSVAFNHEMDFKSTDEFKMISYFRLFKLFSKGTSKRITNIFVRKDRLLRSQIRCFDYKYVISSGNTHVAYNQTVFWANCKALGLPSFNMKPENFLHKIGSLFGMKDIDFEEYPAFSDQYLLKSKDADIVRDFFDDRVLHFFSKETGWHIEAVNYYFIMYRHNKLVLPENYPQFISVCQEVYEIFKDISEIKSEFLEKPLMPLLNEEE